MRIETQRGGEHTYSVATWRSEAKAVSLAAAKHRTLGRGHIYDITVQGLGWVDPNADGDVEAPDDDLVDRYEW